MANGWNGDDPPAVVFTYAPPSRRVLAFACQATGRSGSHAMDILKDFNGILQGEEGQQTVRGTVCPTNERAATSRITRETKDDKKRIKDLERDLARKEKALAEAAALIILRKKAEAIWGRAGEDE
jgi:hypothetical protein